MPLWSRPQEGQDPEDPALLNQPDVRAEHGRARACRNGFGPCFPVSLRGRMAQEELPLLRFADCQGALRAWDARCEKFQQWPIPIESGQADCRAHLSTPGPFLKFELARALRTPAIVMARSSSLIASRASYRVLEPTS